MKEKNLNYNKVIINSKNDNTLNKNLNSPSSSNVYIIEKYRHKSLKNFLKDFSYVNTFIKFFLQFIL